MRVTRIASRRIALAACVMLLGTSPLPGAGQAEDERATALRLFSERVGEYAALHRRLEGPLPPLTPTSETVRNYVARQLLANAIRKARPRAAQGDIFTPAVATAFRELIAETLKGRDVEAFLSELNEEHPRWHGARAVVNEPLPKGATHEMPCALLQALPSLPEDVEYRIVDHDLVLWDIHANLVIDFIPHAFAPPRMTMAR